MTEASDTLEHPILGLLAWDSKSQWWVTIHRLPTGADLDVIIDSGTDNRFEFLTRAAELFQWAMVNERQVLAEAMRAELLELYNDTWRQGDEPVLSTEELTNRLDWQLLSISTNDIVPVDFSYSMESCSGITALPLR